MKQILLAQNLQIGGQPITGPLVGIATLGDVINKVLPLLYGIAGLILFFVLVWGGYDFLLSQGAPEKVKSARAKITTGIIGFVLLVISFVIVKLIALIFGFTQNSIF